MKKILAIAIAASLLASSASANYYIPHPVVPKVPPLPPSQPGSHLGAGPWIAGGILGCASIGLLAGAAYKGKTQHRELTLREAHIIAWSCALPIVGGFLFDYLYKANNWQRFEQVPVLRSKW